MTTDAEPISGAEPVKMNKPLKPTQEITTSGLQGREKKATFKIVERPDGKKLRVVIGEPPNPEVARYFQENIASEVKNPKNWLFIIEGKNFEKSGIHGIEAACKLAEKEGILVVDPIFHPYQPEVIKFYLDTEEGKTIPPDVVVDLFATDLYNAVYLKYHKLPRDKRTSGFEEIATILGVDSWEKLSEAMLKAASEKKKDPNLYDRRRAKMREGLLGASNAITLQAFNYVLGRYPNRPEVVLYLGDAHEAILDTDLSQIPPELKLSNIQLEKMLAIRGWKGVEAIMENMPGLPDSFKNALIRLSDNILYFNLDYVKSRGYEEYLNSPNSLHQLWGAAVLMEDRLVRANGEGRDLTPQELEEIKTAFKKAAETRRNDEPHSSEADEWMEVANGVETLVQIAKELWYKK